MSRVSRLLSFPALVMLRSRSSWTRWRRSRMTRQLEREQRRLALLERLELDSRERLARLERRLRPVVLLPPPPPVDPQVEEMLQELARRPVQIPDPPRQGQLPPPAQLPERLLLVEGTPEPEPEPRPSALEEISQLIGLPTPPTSPSVSEN